MHVKGDNIFIDSNGKWLLSDFGSCERTGQFVTTDSSTDMVVPYTLAHFDSGTLVDVVDDLAKISTVCDQDECSETSGVNMAVIGQIQDVQGGAFCVFVSVSKHTAVDILRGLGRGSDGINYVDICE